MSDSVWIFAGVFGIVVVGVLLWRRAVSRRNAAGIATSMSARTGQMGSLVTRSVFRKLRLRLRQLLASHERKKQLEEQYHLHSAEEAAKVMGNMKGVFMKLGQIISFASESLPPAAQQALRGLQKDAPPMDFRLARGVVEEELGGDLAKFFKDFDEEPLASASIGQVHKARLLSGDAVAVKIQYPGVDKAIEADLRASAGLAVLINSVNKNVDAKAVVAELKERMLDELDYRQELRNQQLFCEIWDGHPYIRIPKVYPEFSAKRVLTQEFKRGLGYYDFLEQATERECRLAVYVLHDFVFDSMHIHRVFNGDPHPGNYIFHEDGGITFLDFGCIKYFTEKFIRQVQALAKAMIHKDRDAFDRCVKEIGMVLPGRPYDREWMWGFFLYHFAPFAEDRVFAFTKEWLREAAEVMDPVKLQGLNLPPDLLFFNRITFGLNAIMQQLGADDNFHRISRRYMFEEENVPPSLHSSAGVRLEERFMSARQHTARQVRTRENLEGAA